MKALALFKSLFILLLVIFITACSEKPGISRPDVATEMDRLWNQRQTELQQISSWKIEGRLGVKTSDDAWSASFKWDRQNETTRLRIIAPFHGIYEIKQIGKQFSLTTPENETITTENPEQEMQANIGWSLPIRSLAEWAVGLPDNDKPIDQLQLNKFAELVKLIQQDWTVEFSRYKTIKDYSLPARISLTNSFASITVLIKEWKQIQ